MSSGDRSEPKFPADVYSGRPRIRLHSPTIFFRLSATLRPDKEVNNPTDSLLQSGIPGSINLLESLKGDPALNGVEPWLSDSKLHGISPKSYDSFVNDGNLRVGTQMAFRGLPAISSRVRYSKSHGRAGRFSVIATLDVETGAFSDEDISITHVNMQLSEGSAQDMGKGTAPPLPLKCRPKDNPTFLFSLTPSGPDLDTYNHSLAKTVLITVHATVLVSENCRPTIEMRWKTGIDFSAALNPIHGAPGPSMQRPNRPISLQRTSSTADGDTMAVSAREGKASYESGSNEQQHRMSSVVDFGISITFTAPKAVYVGEVFSWDVLILNRSSKPRQLALIVIPRRRKGLLVGTHSARSSSSSMKGRKVGEFADSVIDENVLYAMQRNAGHEAMQVISMSTDVRVG